jgi:hypothetical protein
MGRSPGEVQSLRARTDGPRPAVPAGPAGQRGCGPSPRVRDDTGQRRPGEVHLRSRTLARTAARHLAASRDGPVAPYKRGAGKHPVSPSRSRGRGSICRVQRLQQPVRPGQRGGYPAVVVCRRLEPGTGGDDNVRALRSGKRHVSPRPTARAWRHPSAGPSAPGPDLRRPASCVRDVTWSLRNTLRR